MSHTTKYYFISYSNHIGPMGQSCAREEFKCALLKGLHPLEWQVENSRKCLINWKDISKEEYEEYIEYIG